MAVVINVAKEGTWRVWKIPRKKRALEKMLRVKASVVPVIMAALRQSPHNWESVAGRFQEQHEISVQIKVIRGTVKIMCRSFRLPGLEQEVSFFTYFLERYCICNHSFAHCLNCFPTSDRKIYKWVLTCLFQIFTPHWLRQVQISKRTASLRFGDSSCPGHNNQHIVKVGRTRVIVKAHMKGRQGAICLDIFTYVLCKWQSWEEPFYVVI